MIRIRHVKSTQFEIPDTFSISFGPISGRHFSRVSDGDTSQSPGGKTD